MKKFDLVYVVHFHDLTQKSSEKLEVDVQTADDLINVLDGRYPGFADMVRKKDGKPNPRNSMVVNRSGERAKHMTNFSVELRNGDRITFL